MALVQVELLISGDPSQRVLIENSGDDCNAYQIIEMMAGTLLGATFQMGSIIDAMENYIDEHKEHKEDENV
jgi:hypothetical protein